MKVLSKKLFCIILKMMLFLVLSHGVSAYDEAPAESYSSDLDYTIAMMEDFLNSGTKCNPTDTRPLSNDLTIYNYQMINHVCSDGVQNLTRDGLVNIHTDYGKKLYCQRFLDYATENSSSCKKVVTTESLLANFENKCAEMIDHYNRAKSDDYYMKEVKISHQEKIKELSDTYDQLSSEQELWSVNPFLDNKEGAGVPECQAVDKNTLFKSCNSPYYTPLLSNILTMTDTNGKAGRDTNNTNATLPNSNFQEDFANFLEFIKSQDLADQKIEDIIATFAEHGKNENGGKHDLKMYERHIKLFFIYHTFRKNKSVADKNDTDKIALVEGETFQTFYDEYYNNIEKDNLLANFDYNQALEKSDTSLEESFHTYYAAMAGSIQKNNKTCTEIQDNIQDLCNDIKSGRSSLTNEGQQQCLEFMIDKKTHTQAMDYLEKKGLAQQANSLFYDMAGYSCILSKSGDEREKYRCLLAGKSEKECSGETVFTENPTYNGNNQDPKEQPKVITKAQVDRLKKLAKSIGIDPAEVDKFKAKNTARLYPVSNNASKTTSSSKPAATEIASLNGAASNINGASAQAVTSPAGAFLDESTFPLAESNSTDEEMTSKNTGPVSNNTPSAAELRIRQLEEQLSALQNSNKKTNTNQTLKAASGINEELANSLLNQNNDDLNAEIAEIQNEIAKIESGEFPPESFNTNGTTSSSGRGLASSDDLNTASIDSAGNQAFGADGSTAPSANNNTITNDEEADEGSSANKVANKQLTMISSSTGEQYQVEEVKSLDSLQVFDGQEYNLEEIEQNLKVGDEPVYIAISDEIINSKTEQRTKVYYKLIRLPDGSIQRTKVILKISGEAGHQSPSRDVIRYKKFQDL